jgi:hypothetical protein
VPFWRACLMAITFARARLRRSGVQQASRRPVGARW